MHNKKIKPNLGGWNHQIRIISPFLPVISCFIYMFKDLCWRSEHQIAAFMWKVYRYPLTMPVFGLCTLSSWGLIVETRARIRSSRQFPPFPLLRCCFPPALPSSPWREQSHEPLMRGFRFASTQPRLELMNKSNEWHVIIGQRERDGQRVGASGRKPEIICLENLQNEREQLHFVFFLQKAAAAKLCCTCARAAMEGKWPHAHTESAVWISIALLQQLCHFFFFFARYDDTMKLVVFCRSCFFSISEIGFCHSQS